MKKQLAIITASILIGAVVLGDEVSLNESSDTLDKYSYLSDLFSRITWDEEFLGGKRLSVKSLAHIAALDTTCEMRVKSPVADVEVEERDYYKPPFGRVLRRSEMAQIGDRFKALARIKPTYYADSETWQFSNWFFNPDGTEVLEYLPPDIWRHDPDNSVTWNVDEIGACGTEIDWGNFVPDASGTGERGLWKTIINKMNGMTGADSVSIPAAPATFLTVEQWVAKRSTLPTFFAWDGFPIQYPLLAAASWIAATHDTCLWMATDKAFDITYRRRAEGYHISFDWEKIYAAVNQYISDNSSLEYDEWTTELEVSDCIIVSTDPTVDKTENEIENAAEIYYRNEVYYTPVSLDNTGSTFIDLATLTTDYIDQNKAFVKNALIEDGGETKEGKLYQLNFSGSMTVPTSGEGWATWYFESRAVQDLYPSSIAHETKFMTDYVNYKQNTRGCAFYVIAATINGITERRWSNNNRGGNNALLNTLRDIGDGWRTGINDRAQMIPFYSEIEEPPRPTYETKITINMRSFGTSAEKRNVYWFESNDESIKTWVDRTLGEEDNDSEYVYPTYDYWFELSNASMAINWTNDFEGWENKAFSIFSSVLPYGVLRINTGFLKAD